MEIVVDANFIIGLAGLITALSVIVGLIVTTAKQIQKWNAYDQKIATTNSEIANLKKEQFLQIKTERAILDGLHQLGCNGQTTKAAKELDDYILKVAHDIDPKIQ